MRQRSLLMLVVLGVALTLYAVSLKEPAILFRLGSMEGGKISMQAVPVTRSGAEMATLGIFGPFMFNFAVLANPLLLAGSVLLIRRRTRGALVCLGLAALLALQTFQLLGESVPQDEGGVNHLFMVRPLVGWYCWFAAILLTLALATYCHVTPEE